MMIRESRRQRMPKLSKNLERLFKEKKCRKCSVVVSKMDFAKILGKFTKVKIQYETSSPTNKRVSIPSAKAREALSSSPNVNARLKNNENGMVLLPRSAYNEHPAKDLKSNRTKTASPKNSNVLKENNRLKKTPAKQKKTDISGKKSDNSNLKHYKIVFKDPKKKNAKEISKLTLSQLVPSINIGILPTEEWCIDYFPRQAELKDEKVYDRIAAELEDLMSNDKPKEVKHGNAEKNDDFPSIMDILNDNSGLPNSSNTEEIKSTLESSDVEAMLLGKVSEAPSKTLDDLTTTPVKENSDSAKENTNKSDVKDKTDELPDTDNPASPSILNDEDEKSSQDVDQQKTIGTKNSPEKMDVDRTEKPENETVFDNNNSIITDPDNVTFVTFKKNLNGKCYKSVTCSKTLKYTVELEGKSVEFLGAPKYVSSLEDLKVLLQIVNESELQSLYVMH